MAQPKIVPEKSGDTIKEKDKDTEKDEGHFFVRNCSVCLRHRHQPTILGSGWINAYLNLKDLVDKRKMYLPYIEQFERPKLVSVYESQEESGSEEEYWWFIENQISWWKLTPKISNELEASYKNGKTAIDIWMGTFHSRHRFNFQLMHLQVFHAPCEDMVSYRLIKRDRKSAPCKGEYDFVNLALKSST